MKAFFGTLGVASVAIAASVGFAHLQAATNPLLDYCPATQTGSAGSCVVAANMLLAVGRPSDDSLIASINAIAGQVQAGPTRGSACADAADGIKVLAAAVRDPATRAMAEALGTALCGPGFGGGGSTAAVVSTGSLSVPVSPAVCSRSTSGSSGQSSGQSSGSSSAC